MQQGEGVSNYGGVSMGVQVPEVTFQNGGGCQHARIRKLSDTRATAIKHGWYVCDACGRRRFFLELELTADDARVLLGSETSQQTPREWIPLLARSVDDLELSVRSANCLGRAGIRTIGELVQKTGGDLLRLKHFGRKSYKEMIAVLSNLGLELGSHNRIAEQVDAERERIAGLLDAWADGGRTGLREAAAKIREGSEG